MKDGSVEVEVAPHEGVLSPWWTEYRVEVVGLRAMELRAALGERMIALTRENGRWGARVTADPAGGRVVLR